MNYKTEKKITLNVYLEGYTVVSREDMMKIYDEYQKKTPPEAKEVGLSFEILEGWPDSGAGLDVNWSYVIPKDEKDFAKEQAAIQFRIDAARTEYLRLKKQFEGT